MIKKFLKEITRLKTVTSKGRREITWRVAKDDIDVDKDITLIENWG